MSENCVASEKVNDPILYLNSQSLGASGCFCKKYPCSFLNLLPQREECHILYKAYQLRSKKITRIYFL